jgi:predicted nucleic acid-binding protein
LAPPPRRVWCACTIINYLVGKEVAAECKLIVEQAKRGELEIVTSILAEAEVVKLEGGLSEGAEARIREFFGRNYVIRAALDVPVVELARDLVRRYRGLKPLDAVHIATALHHNVPILETYDGDMIRLVNGKEGNPPLIVRNPLYEGTRPLPLDM